MSADPTENDSQGPAKDLEPVDSEVTPVGGTSKKLLELSEGGDQNTRAYRAPRELLELARRQRALGFRPSQPAEARLSAAPPVPIHGVHSEPVAPWEPASSSHDAPSRLAAPEVVARPALSKSAGANAAVSRPGVSPPSTSAPGVSKPAVSSAKQSSLRSTGERPSSPQPVRPASATPANADRDSGEASSQKRRVRPVSLSPSDFSEGEAAPPRPIAESLGPRDRPTRRPGRSEESSESSGPSISYQPASSRSADSVEALQGEAAEPVPDSDADSDVDAAPPVARSRPSRALSSEPSPSPARPAASLAELVRTASDRSAAPSSLAPNPHIPANDLELDVPTPSSLSTNVAAARSRVYFWTLIFVLFIALGFLLARWRVLELVLPPAR
jgi:hypothetical protein